MDLAGSIEQSVLPFSDVGPPNARRRELYKRADEWYLRIGFEAAGGLEVEIPFGRWEGRARSSQ